MNTVKIDKFFRGMIAHRGLSGIETENTLNAFIAAANRSYFGIECDVYMSKDKQIIITHDDTLLRLGLLNIHIPSYNYEEIRKFTLMDRKTGHLSDALGIPLLKDYLSVVHTYEKQAFIELKHNLSNDDLDQIIQEVVHYHSLAATSIISFNDKYLVTLRKKYPDLDIYYLSNTLDEKVFDLCEKHRFHFDIHHKAVSEAWVKKIHLLGLKIATFTINDKDQAEKFIKYGVDYITTDILE
jgi:glycerophosphoryl diester phosphodiesterase